VKQTPNGIRQSYDTRFKLKVINHAQKTKAEADRKLHLKNLSVAPRMDVHNKESSKSLNLSSQRENLQCLLQDNEIYRGQQLPKSHNLWHNIKAITGGGVQDANQWVHCSHQN
jgi:hypothetical protein